MHKRPGHFGRGTARIMLKDPLWNTGRIFSACLTKKPHCVYWPCFNIRLNIPSGFLIYSMRGEQYDRQTAAEPLQYRSNIYMFLIPLLIAAALLLIGTGIALYVLETVYLPKIGLSLQEMHHTRAVRVDVRKI